MKLVILDNGRINIVAETPMDKAFLLTHGYMDTTGTSLKVKAISYYDKNSAQRMLIICPDREQVKRPANSITCPSCNATITDTEKICGFCNGVGWVVIAKEKKTKAKGKARRRTVPHST